MTKFIIKYIISDFIIIKSIKLNKMNAPLNQPLQESTASFQGTPGTIISSQVAQEPQTVFVPPQQPAQTSQITLQPNQSQFIQNQSQIIQAPSSNLMTLNTQQPQTSIPQISIKTETADPEAPKAYIVTIIVFCSLLLGIALLDIFLQSLLFDYSFSFAIFDDALSFLLAMVMINFKWRSTSRLFKQIVSIISITLCVVGTVARSVCVSMLSYGDGGCKEWYSYREEYCIEWDYYYGKCREYGYVWHEYCEEYYPDTKGNKGYEISFIIFRFIFMFIPGVLIAVSNKKLSKFVGSYNLTYSLA